MRRLNQEVDGRHRDPAEVARAFLVRSGCSDRQSRRVARTHLHIGMEEVDRAHPRRLKRPPVRPRSSPPSGGVEEDRQERGGEQGEAERDQEELVEFDRP